MSTVIAKNIQIGTSGTPAQNFTWYQPASPDGTVRLGVGNTGATTLDAITATSAGDVTVAGSLAGGALSGSSLAVSGATTTGSLTVNSNNISAVNSLGFRNRIINGAMVIDQRNAGASVTLSGGQYLLDRWRSYTSQASKLSAQQSTTVPTGFTNSMLFTSLSAFTPAATDEFFVDQRIEGVNVADLAWGTASAQSITVSFWVRSSLTGTFSGAIVNSSGNRNYPFTFTISAANTFEYKTVTIPGDTTGTWLTNTGIGLQLKINLGTGSTYLQPAGAWTSSYANGASGSVALVATNGATFYITGVQLEAGSVATPFERRDYGRELMMCQRYYWNESSTNYTLAAFSGSSTYRGTRVRNPVPMRASATYTGTVTNGSINIDSLTTLGSRVFVDLGNNTSTSDLTAITASAEL